ncbi:MAG TPA: hypothetical protein PL033_16895 [Candidatus Brocadiia bacterium]|nr:hypothetical protein [Candidatus Brocadiia bacterium]
MHGRNSRAAVRRRGSVERSMMILVVICFLGAGFVLYFIGRLQTIREVNAVRSAGRGSSGTQRGGAEARDEYLSHLRKSLAPGRVLELAVTGREKSPEGWVGTSIRVVERRADRSVFEAVNLTIKGEVAYCDAIVLTFQDRPGGDEGGGICLFRRLFTDRDSPGEGYEFFPVEDAKIPDRQVSRRHLPEVQEQVWARLRRMISEPDFARASGVRVELIEPIPVVLAKGRTYSIRLAEGSRLVVEERSAETLPAEAEPAGGGAGR